MKITLKYVCYICDKEIISDDGYMTTSGYCSEECFKEHMSKCKDPIFMPYIPLQVKKIEIK